MRVLERIYLARQKIGGKNEPARQNTAHVEPLCSAPLRNNLPIELKGSLPIGSANRQSTLHVEA